MVPRWRSLAVTIAAKELSSPTKQTDGDKPTHIAPDMLDKLVQWRKDPTVVSAGELVEAALVDAMEKEAASAARYLLSLESTATPPLRRLAGLALKRAGYPDEVPDALEIHPVVKKNVWRQRTRLYPFNPLGWVELALFDVTQGRRDAALRSMLIALQLAPDNRHVLRCASRLFLHLHDPARAYEIIIRSPATPHDPWLMAAELSIAELANRKPRFFEQGRRMVEEGQHHPRQITEVSGALATLELVAGRKKKSRDLFRHSIVDPTGNSLAQAEWASPAFGTDIIPRQTYQTVKEADEANAFHLLREEKFIEVSAACTSWSKAEPYSIRPFEVGASTAAMIGHYSIALDFARKGLMVRHDASKLLNTQAFCLANLGRLKEAEQSLRNISDNDESVTLVSLANRGLIQMRSGQTEAGTVCYRTVIDQFKKMQNFQLSTIAKVYFAHEAARAHLPNAAVLVAEAKEEYSKTSSTGHSHLLKDAETALAAEVVPTNVALEN
ncbi:hypothetical protein [Phyllobacterium sp. P30BS-XVII]|uniref:hypothetical protein n=1 Tax=Phyllobacterium sp. P30BS-XVII TaxID=2587046 RepID=UPI0015FC15F2|nr:hypothetical protein [Phyllobacterium sp. P30BS-XVII]